MFDLDCAQNEGAGVATDPQEHTNNISASSVAAVPSNVEFIEAMTQRVPAGLVVWVAEVHGVPVQSNPGWKGSEWTGDELDHSANTYWNISVLKDASSRKAENFAGLLCVVLDDVGVKAELPANAPKPTYRLETSPGSFQIGYRLRVPETDLGKCKRLFSALGDRALTDKGADGPSSRYVRLPQGTNRKEKCGADGFKHRMAEWNPLTAYGFDELVQAFGLDLSEKPKAKATTAPRKPTQAAPDADVIQRVLKRSKARTLWFDAGAGGGDSENDEYLLAMIALETTDADQIERIYGESARAERRSSDGDQKWLTREDYREASIRKAQEWAAENEHGDVQAASELVENTINLAEADKSNRKLLAAPEVMEAMAVLKMADPVTYGLFLSEFKRLGVNKGTVQGEVEKISDKNKVCDADAADGTIERMGGRENVSFKGRLMVYKSNEGIWTEEEDDAIKQTIQAVLPRPQITASKQGSVLSVLKASIFDARGFTAGADPYQVCVANGVIEIRPKAAKGERLVLLPHSRDFRLTTSIPWAWDPKAQAPVFQGLLRDWFLGDGDAKEKADFIRRFIGYSLTTSTKFEKFVFLWGPANNGKSTLLNILGELVGMKNMTALSMQQLGERFGPGKLKDKLICAVGEVEAGQALPDGAIKKLTSGDVFTAELKNGQLFEFSPYATLWMASNHPPKVNDFSAALIEKRCVLIEMGRVFKGVDVDMDLEEKLTAEMPGILNMCLEAYADALAELGALALAEPPSSERAKREWRSDADPVRTFFERRTMRSEDMYRDIDGVTSKDVFKAWEEYRAANGIKTAPSSMTLARELGKLYGIRSETEEARFKRGKAWVRGFRGIALVDDHEEG